MHVHFEHHETSYSTLFAAGTFAKYHTISATNVAISSHIVGGRSLAETTQESYQNFSSPQFAGENAKSHRMTIAFRLTPLTSTVRGYRLTQQSVSRKQVNKSVSPA